jgi:mannan endo-1,4-beta-mannosidase
MLSGQFTNFGPNARIDECRKAFETTGHWPGMIGIDYADFGKGGLETATPNKVAIDYARQGGLVALCVHLPNPANPNGGGLRDRGVNMADLLTEGTDTHRRWMALLDQMADGLAELRDAGVVVLFRPFHEMNGGWFWWGQPEPETFKAVWKHMFDYYSNEKKLDNLLWVYGPNHGPRIADYYPGDASIDIVGLDAYTDHVDPDHIKGYDALIALKKPFGFTEFGPHGPEKPPGDYDYRRFLTGVRQHFPATGFVLFWHAGWALGTNQYTKEILDDPRVLNREDVPAALHAGAP